MAAKVTVLDTSSALLDPLPRLALDGPRLMAWLHAEAPETLIRTPGAAPVTIQSFSHGQSNPTYLLTSSELTSGSLVLRRMPPGQLLHSAHAVDREYRVLSALAKGSRVPVPRPVAYCSDASIAGTPFYVMEYAKGFIFVDPNLPTKTPEARNSIYRQMARCLADLHAADVQALGLQGYGNPDNYCQRQLSRWSTQYRASMAQVKPEVQQLMDWLAANVPPEDASPVRPSICHGDYRLDNLVYKPTGQPDQTLQLCALLDWELSTLGNRWADVAYNCMPYHLPEELQVLQRLGGKDGLAAGIPSEEEYVSWYCEAAGCAPPSPQAWSFYLVLALFRVLAILAGVQARAKQGNASSRAAGAMSSDSVLKSLAQAAHVIIQRGTAVAPLTTPPAREAGSRPMPMDVGAPLPPHVQKLHEQIKVFMQAHVYASEEVFEAHAMGPDRWTVHPLMEQLKDKAKAQGLWNLWLSVDVAKSLTHLLPLASSEAEQGVLLGVGLSNWEYAHLCELMGRSLWAPEVFNCSAPDTGNMEVLAKYGSQAQQERWLVPLLQGRCRSCFAMTEKAVASSDATNIQASIQRDGDCYELNGLKWWTSGACDPRCQVAIFMGKTDTSAPQHLQQSMILVPMSAPGVRVVRPLLVFGFDDAPHGHAEVAFDSVRVPLDHMILGEGRGFEIAQGRLGPGRLHHCMRLIGLGERAIDAMATRARQRIVFGGPLAAQGAFQAELAKCRIDLDGARLLVLHAAAALDRMGNKGARGPIAAAKVAAPAAALRVVDAAIQAHGGAGVSQDTVLARLWTAARTLRLADGPDEVHLVTLAKLELARVAKL